MKRKITLVLLLVILMATLAGCKCRHEWQDADCVTPKTCSKCGETEGEALGHTWEEATCEEPMRCVVCGATEGDALGHVWEYATLNVPKKCKVCEKVEGTPLTKADVNAAVLKIQMTQYNLSYSMEQRIREYFGGMTEEQKLQCIALYGFYSEAPDYLENEVRNSLMDPKSYRKYKMDVSNILTYDEESNEFCGTIKLDYGGANAFGGMAREIGTFWLYFKVDIENWDVRITKMIAW